LGKGIKDLVQNAEMKKSFPILDTIHSMNFNYQNIHSLSTSGIPAGQVKMIVVTQSKAFINSPSVLFKAEGSFLADKISPFFYFQVLKRLKKGCSQPV
jgi:hypothetical protein